MGGAEAGMGGKYSAARAKRRWRGLAAAAWVLMAVAISLLMHWTLRRQSMDRAEERLVSMCEERARMLQEQFGTTVNHVRAIAILIFTFNYEKSPSAIDQVCLLRHCSSCVLQCRSMD